MNPEAYAKGRTESEQQIALFMWASLPETRERYPELRWLHHCPNGGSRGDSARSAAIAGGRLKAEGVKPGVPDLFLPVPTNCHMLDGAIWADKVWPVNGSVICGLYIEMKAPGKKSQTSDEQKEFIAHHRNLGYACVVCDSYHEARFYIEQYLGVR